jgi:hypothetical protein
MYLLDKASQDSKTLDLVLSRIPVEFVDALPARKTVTIALHDFSPQGFVNVARCFSAGRGKAHHNGGPCILM